VGGESEEVDNSEDEDYSCGDEGDEKYQACETT
jgi:hypothetical protein